MGEGRTDESGDLHPGCQTVSYANCRRAAVSGTQTSMWRELARSLRFEAPNSRTCRKRELPAQGLDRTSTRSKNLCRAAGFGREAEFALDLTVIRGLEYYTGPVFEAELTFEVKGDDGKPVRFGSVGGGGRYDDLVSRFTGQKVPATGFSIGVSRLASGPRPDRCQACSALGPVVVLVMDKAEIAAIRKWCKHFASRHPRRNVSRLVRDEGADEVCRQAQRALRHHSRL